MKWKKSGAKQLRSFGIAKFSTFKKSGAKHLRSFCSFSTFNNKCKRFIQTTTFFLHLSDSNTYSLRKLFYLV